MELELNKKTEQLIYDINSLVCSLLYESKIINNPDNYKINNDDIDNIITIIHNIYNFDNNLYNNIYNHIIKIYNIEKYNKRRKCFKSHVLSLKQNDNIEQRTSKWYEVRKNMLTASDWGAALGKNKYSSKKKTFNDKVYGSNFFGNKYTQWGVKYEQIASMFYSIKTTKTLIDFGLIKHKKYDFLGASPDNISECGIMLEIKCPFSREINGSVPLHYWIQMQAQLEVCELERCDYLECKISEYNNKNDYLIDNTTLNKGCVIEIYDEDNKILDYKYSNFNLNLKDLDLWILNFTHTNSNNNYSYNITYWKIDKFFLVPVYRDSCWFNNNINELIDFWNNVKIEKIKYENILNDDDDDED
jgi:putative phage-type endonuclease